MALPVITDLYQSRPCSQCPFRKTCTKGWLGASRAREIAESATFVCHKNHKKQCAGSMMLNGENNTFVALAFKLGIDLRLRGFNSVFKTAHEMISHHKLKNREK